MDNNIRPVLEQIAVGGDRNFAYLFGDPESGAACVIDPAHDPEKVYRRSEERGLIIRYVFNTHSHSDHTNGNKRMEELSGITAIGYGDAEHESGQKVQDNSRFRLGGFEIRVLHTPGHTPDSICLLIGEALFTGDTLFVGKVGGTDLGEQAKAEYDSLHNKILTLPGTVKIYPGHDYGTKPDSTIENERKTNPFLQQPDFESFLELKRNWAEYKKKHGIA